MDSAARARPTGGTGDRSEETLIKTKIARVLRRRRLRGQISIEKQVVSYRNRPSGCIVALPRKGDCSPQEQKQYKYVQISLPEGGTRPAAQGTWQPGSEESLGKSWNCQAVLNRGSAGGKWNRGISQNWIRTPYAWQHIWGNTPGPISQGVCSAC